MTAERNGDGARLMERITSLVANLSDDKKQMLLETLVEWQQKEQRSDSRMACLIAVDYATEKRAYRDFMQDLSKGGVFIETRAPLHVGDTLSLTFSLPKSNSNFKITGKIVRSDDKGVGVEFEKKLSHYQEEIIKGSIK